MNLIGRAPTRFVIVGGALYSEGGRAREHVLYRAVHTSAGTPGTTVYTAAPSAGSEHNTYTERRA